MAKKIELESKKMNNAVFDHPLWKRLGTSTGMGYAEQIGYVKSLIFILAVAYR
jgi:hypothetical protein